jgi:hypothetical protein
LGIYEGMKEESQFTQLTLLVPTVGSSSAPPRHQEQQQQLFKKVSAGTAKLGIIMGDYAQVRVSSASVARTRGVCETLISSSCLLISTRGRRSGVTA